MTVAYSAKFEYGNAFKYFRFETEIDPSYEDRLGAALEEVDSIGKDCADSVEFFSKVPDAFSRHGFVRTAK